MELSKSDTKMTKGLAILFMVLLHLFARKTNLPYECIKLGNGVPLIYYFGLFGDCCVAIYCFCSGYAMQLILEKAKSFKEYYEGRLKALLKFLTNYWIVLILFVIVGLITGDSDVPGSLKSFVLNFFLLRSYNGAWWFVLIYVILVLLSGPMYSMIKKYNPIIINVLIIIIYGLAYIQRMKVVINVGMVYVDSVLSILALLGTSILPFVWGMYFYKFKLFTKIRLYLNKHIGNNLLVVISILVLIIMIIAHGIVQSLIVAPFTGLITIVLFNAVKKAEWINKIFIFFGEHSTNIWLTHMFFYAVIFKNLVFSAKYPLLILLFMLAITIGVSYVINLIYKPLCKLIK